MTYWHRYGITYTVEPCSVENWVSHCKGSSATCLNSPLLHSETSPLKVTDVVMDFHASCGGGYPPPDGPWTKEATGYQGPCEAEAERRHQWCAAVGKNKKSKFLMCKWGFCMQHTQSNSLLCFTAAVLYPILETLPSPQHNSGIMKSLEKWQTGRKIVSVESRRDSR